MSFTSTTETRRTDTENGTSTYDSYSDELPVSVLSVSVPPW
jgi:hypothetical protein